MANFKYIGDKESVSLYGFDFPKGEAVSVDDKMTAPLGKKGKLVSIVEKLKGNGQFEEVKAVKKSPAKKTKKSKAAVTVEEFTKEESE